MRWFLILPCMLLIQLVNTDNLQSSRAETKTTAEEKFNEPKTNANIEPSSSENTDSNSSSRDEFDAHKFVGLDLEERVHQTEIRITRKQAMDFLKRFGYLDGEWRGLSGDKLDRYVLPAALRKFQWFSKLSETGILDLATKHEMAKPRCGFPDFQTQKTSGRVKRYILGATKWSMSKNMPLTYMFKDYSKKMRKIDQEKAFDLAVQQWEDNSGLTFKRAGKRANDADIKIYFSKHDGPWGILGKAFFPKVGKIIFENAENWVPDTTNDPKGRRRRGISLSFTAVSTHEMGHVLGISHSNRDNSIMSASYKRDILELTPDDVAAVQRLYGKPSRAKERAAKKRKSKEKNRQRTNSLKTTMNRRRQKPKGSNKPNQKQRQSRRQAAKQKQRKKANLAHKLKKHENRKNNKNRKPQKFSQKRTPKRLRKANQKARPRKLRKQQPRRVGKLRAKKQRNDNFFDSFFPF